MNGSFRAELLELRPHRPNNPSNPMRTLICWNSQRTNPQAASGSFLYLMVHFVDISSKLRKCIVVQERQRPTATPRSTEYLAAVKRSGFLSFDVNKLDMDKEFWEMSRCPDRPSSCLKCDNRETEQRLILTMEDSYVCRSDVSCDGATQSDWWEFPDVVRS